VERGSSTASRRKGDRGIRVLLEGTPRAARPTSVKAPEGLPHSPALALLGAAVLSAAGILNEAVTLEAQERPELSRNVQAFVAVDDSVVALRHVRLVDGTGGEVRDGQTILIRGTRIEAVGDAGEVSIPQGTRVLDLAGHTVMPGLVSLHEHTYLGGLSRTAPLNAGAFLYLAFGVTTGMTAGSQMPYQELNLKRSIDAGVMPGPRLHITGPYLGAGDPSPGTFRMVSSPEEMRRVVAYWADEGATWFKFMAGPRDMLGVLIEEAHARGLRVTGHLCSITFTEAAALGIDALQHGFITNSDYVPDKEPDRCPPGNMQVQVDVDPASPEVRESIRRIVADGAAVVSTLGVYETFVPGRAHLDPRALEMLAPEVRREVEANHEGLAESGFTVPERLFDRMMAWERAFVEAGGLLGAGSDPWGTGFVPGFGNLRNFEILVEAGFAPTEAVRIITLNGARILGEEERLGSVEPGKLADLVVIEGDPMDDPSQVYEVILVFKDGVGYDSERLKSAVHGRVGLF